MIWLTHPKPVWLESVRHERRGLKDIEQHSITPTMIYDLITQKPFTYKDNSTYAVDSQAEYNARDKALMALIFLSCGRINEVLRIIREQIDLESDRDFIIIRDFYVSKRKAKTLRKYGPMLLEIPIPKNPKAELYPFAKLLLDYLQFCPEKGNLFSIGRGRAYSIIKSVTGLWCHYFRSMAFSWYAKVIKSPFALARIYGVENINTITRYFKGEWQDYRKPLSG